MMLELSKHYLKKQHSCNVWVQNCTKVILNTTQLAKCMLNTENSNESFRLYGSLIMN